MNKTKCPMYRTMNNWLCKQIVHSCCFGDYDVAVSVFYNNYQDMTDYLFVNMFEFCWSRCGLKEYHDVLKRLHKSAPELTMFHNLNFLILRYKRKGGVLK